MDCRTIEGLACPAADCPGLDDPAACDFVRTMADLRAGRIPGWPPPPEADDDAPPPDDAAVRLAMRADTCPHGSGPCGCGDGPPRQCSHPGHAGPKRRADCLACPEIAPEPPPEDRSP